MNRFFMLIGTTLIGSSVAVAGPVDLVFENGFENLPDAVEILSFTATPNPVIVGNPTTLDWSLKDADSCIATDGTAEWQALFIDPAVADGSFELIGLDVGVHPFTLTCAGPVGDPATITYQVIVEEIPVCEPPDLTGETISWAAFWQDDFPDIDLGSLPNGDPRNSRLMQIFSTGYRAIVFDTIGVAATGLFEVPDNVFASGPRLGVISKCEGRFDNVPAQCEFTWDSNTGGITWSTEGASGACQLDTEAVYYFNLTYTDGVDPDSTSCDINTEDCYATVKHTLEQ